MFLLGSNRGKKSTLRTQSLPNTLNNESNFTLPVLILRQSWLSFQVSKNVDAGWRYLLESSVVENDSFTELDLVTLHQ